MEKNGIGGTAITADDIAPRLDALGISDYAIRLSEQEVSFSVPQPRTVLQVRTLANYLHFKYIKSEDGIVIGTIYAFAESRDSRPLGVVREEVGTPIIETAKELAEAISDLPGLPRADSLALNNRPFMEVIQDAQLQRYLNAKYGGIQWRLKPGPQERTVEEVIEIVHEWRDKWKKLGVQSHRVVERVV